MACLEDEVEGLRLLNQLLLPFLEEAAGETLAEVIPTAMVRADDDVCKAYNTNINRRRLLQEESMSVVIEMILSPKYGVDDIVIIGNMGLYMKGIRVLFVEETTNINSTSIEKGLGWGDGGVLEPIESPPIPLPPRTQSPETPHRASFYLKLVLLMAGVGILLYGAVMGYCVLQEAVFRRGMHANQYTRYAHARCLQCQ